MLESKRPLKVFLCHAHIIPLWDADRDPVRALPEGTRLTNDGVDAWFDKEKPCGERRTNPQPTRLGTGNPQGGIIAASFRRFTMKYKIRLEETDEGFAVWVPGLPGCWSQGETEEEAIENIKDAIKTYLETVEILLEDQQTRMVEVPV